ncbi:MAG: hypothetical protein HYZ68_02565 [Chloroflexi bacterium]|nr:hypothetical protein [Chloroflexota bacterium]
METPTVFQKPSLARYGWVGLGMVLVAEALMWAKAEPVSTWFIPIVWTGYILLVDALVLRLSGHSLIHDRLREFLMMIPTSVGIWLIFEAYNLHLGNWYYLGVPSPPWRYIGFFWSFATILPGIFETSDLLDATRIFGKGPRGYQIALAGRERRLVASGLVFLSVPLLMPFEIARYLFGLVWVGFIPLLAPINAHLGAPSLLADWERGDYRTTVRLLSAGLVCGFLWEFWNFWAQAKWIYAVPILADFKIFEMPLLGFLGFPPFAIECYLTYHFVKHGLNRLGAGI